jgi:probable rRNA maturation factor
VDVAFAGERRALAARTVRRVVDCVLSGERIEPSRVTVTFMSVARMRGLNRRTFGRDCATDVISFGMKHDANLVADIYVCPHVARRSARRYGASAREELIRLVVHGTLHALGYDHPAGINRVTSPMWKRQEAYVHQVLEGSC